MDELMPPQKIAYVVTRANKPQWYGSSVVLLGVLIVVGASIWFWRSRSLKRLPPIDLPAVGLRAKIKMKWDDGARYIFTVRPLEGTSEHFDKTLRSQSYRGAKFDLRLVDSDGFVICSDSPAVSKKSSADGHYVALQGQGEFQYCDKERFARATDWHLSYSFPPLVDPPSQQPAEGSAASSRESPNPKYE